MFKERFTVNDEMGRIRNESAVAYFKVLFDNVPREAEEYHENISYKNGLEAKNQTRYLQNINQE